MGFAAALYYLQLVGVSARRKPLAKAIQLSSGKAQIALFPELVLFSAEIKLPLNLSTKFLGESP